MNNDAIAQLLQHPNTTEEQVRDMIKELKLYLDILNNAPEITKEMEDCKKKYSEVLQIIGELNDKFCQK